jgi:hypothetical protein
MSKHICYQCKAQNHFVNQCGCDKNNMPTRPVLKKYWAVINNEFDAMGRPVLAGHQLFAFDNMPLCSPQGTQIRIVNACICDNGNVQYWELYNQAPIMFALMRWQRTRHHAGVGRKDGWL